MMNVKQLYGFVGLGQMGGNEVKSIYAKGYSVMAANTAQSDLDGLDIPEDCKYHILGGYGSSKERKKAKQLLAENDFENFDLLINEIEERFKDCRVIFLIGSSGGGSGSAMLPAIKKRLLDKTDKIICTITCTPDDIKTNYLDSMIANINTLYAKDAQLENLIASKASVDDLEAAVARIFQLESTYITAAKVKADYMEVNNWTSAGKIRADRIDVDDLVTELGKADAFGCKSFACSGTAHISHIETTSSIKVGAFELSVQNKKVLDENGNLTTIWYLGM